MQEMAMESNKASRSTSIAVQRLVSQDWITIGINAAFSNGRCCRLETVKNDSGRIMAWLERDFALSLGQAEAKAEAEAEAKALLLAASMARKKGWSRVLSFTDCRVLVHALNNTLDHPWEMAAIMADIKTMMSSFECKIEWIGRDG